MKIFLLGFMGSGKSHVGKRLAARAGLAFVDLDHWIEQAQGESIARIFETKGEAAFREIERAALYEMAAKDAILVSCGGGTPCFFDNMAWMNQHGITIYLETPVDILLHRLRPQQAKRPLLQDFNETELQAFIISKLAERAPFYEQAQVIYRVNTKEEEVSEGLFQQLKNVMEGPRDRETGV